MSDRSNARARLDSRLTPLRQLVDEPRPHRGWIRAIRDAIGMSPTDLAARLGVSRQAVQLLEQSEQRGTIKLETLQRAANALDCDVVYFLLPRQPLEEAVRAQARMKAAQHLQRVSHQSRLEDQTVAAEESAGQLEELAARLIDRRDLWSEPESR